MRLVGGQYAFVDTQHVQSFEVNVTGLQKAHDLQPVSATTVELDGSVGIQQLEQDFKVFDVVYIAIVTFHDLCDAVDALSDGAHLVEQKQQAFFLFTGLYLVGYEL